MVHPQPEEAMQNPMIFQERQLIEDGRGSGRMCIIQRPSVFSAVTTNNSDTTFIQTPMYLGVQM